MKYLSKDYKLLKSFIQSEFFFQYNKKANNFVSKEYLLNKNSLTVLDPVVHLKSIKQFIRILQFLKNNEFPFLQIVVKNSQFDFLIYDFIKKNSKDLHAIESMLDSDLKKNIDYSKIVLLFDCFLQSDSNFFHKSQYSVFNILFKVNDLTEKNYFQNYKIQSSVDSLKKVIFLLIIIKQIFKK